MDGSDGDGGEEGGDVGLEGLGGLEARLGDLLVGEGLAGDARGLVGAEGDGHALEAAGGGDEQVGHGGHAEGADAQPRAGVHLVRRLVRGAGERRVGALEHRHGLLPHADRSLPRDGGQAGRVHCRARDIKRA